MGGWYTLSHGPHAHPTRTNGPTPWQMVLTEILVSMRCIASRGKPWGHNDHDHEGSPSYHPTEGAITWCVVRPPPCVPLSPNTYKWPHAVANGPDQDPSEYEVHSITW